MTTTTDPTATRQQVSGTGDAIVVSGLHRSYVTSTRLNILTGRREPTGHFEAVRGVDLRVGRGELFALLGTNGAGKTSTVELVEGLARPSRGTIRVLGHDPYAQRRLVQGRTGVVLQSSGFPPSLTVAEMARFWHGTLSRPASAEAAVEAVGLTDRADVETAKLSGGEWLPEPVARVAHLLPMTPVIDLVTFGYTGVGIDGRVLTGTAEVLAGAGGMLLPLVVWTAGALLLGMRRFRWDPRS